MYRTKRSFYEPQENGKDSKKHKPFHLQAQRKFASFFPASPTKKEKSITPGRSHKAEDFIEFLCVRHNTPTLPHELDVFTEPQYNQEEIYSEDDSDDELPLQAIRLASQLERGKQTSTTSNCNGNSKTMEDNSSHSADSDNNICSERSSTNNNHKQKIVKKGPVDIIDIKSTIIKLHEQKDFFKCMSNIRKCHETLALVSPPENVKIAGYALGDIDLAVETKHIHRLKLTLCTNLITSRAIIKQLENESVPINELPKIGMCELDLPLLRDTVNSFGGVECVNRDQCWKTVADNLSIPKNASRRVKHIENVYLKYILPYETLPKDDKVNLKNSLTTLDGVEFWPVEKTCSKKTNVVMFKRMADSYKTMYCRRAATWEDVERKFWNTVSKGERHICGTSSEIDLLKEPRDYENSKLTVCWRLQNIFSQEASALKYLGQTSKISVPVLLLEGIFSTSKWCLQEHGFTVVSYLHYGEEKIWYAVPEESTKHFLCLKQEFKDFVTPSELVSKGCQVTRCVQKEGQYVTIQPNCYYCSVASGYSMSEVVTIAPLSWFTSSNLLSFKPSLNEFVVTKLIINCSIDESENEEKSFCCQFLVEKLDAIAKMISANIKKLNEVGINACKLLEPEEVSPSACSKCNCVCYLVCVKSRNLPLCVDDALKLTKRKAEEFVIELILNVEKIQSLITHCKIPTKKKRK